MKLAKAQLEMVSQVFVIFKPNVDRSISEHCVPTDFTAVKYRILTHIPQWEFPYQKVQKVNTKGIVLFRHQTEKDV